MSTPPAANPPTREMLTNHELAHRIITQHNTDLAIFDEENLARLKRFSTDPSPETQRWMLERYDAVDPDGTPEQEIGMLAAKKGDLVGYVVARYGKVKDDHHTFHPEEVEALREWFAEGGGQ